MVSSQVSRFGVAPEEGIKAPCVVSTTTNIALTGTQVINAVAVVVDDRVLVKDQTNSAENGIYVVKAGAWERATDMNDASDMLSGMLVFAATPGSLYSMIYAGAYDPGATILTIAVV